MSIVYEDCSIASKCPRPENQHDRPENGVYRGSYHNHHGNRSRISLRFLSKRVMTQRLQMIASLGRVHCEVDILRILLTVTKSRQWHVRDFGILFIDNHSIHNLFLSTHLADTDFLDAYIFRPLVSRELFQ